MDDSKSKTNTGLDSKNVVKKDKSKEKDLYDIIHITLSHQIKKLKSLIVPKNDKKNDKSTKLMSVEVDTKVFNETMAKLEESVGLIGSLKKEKDDQIYKQKVVFRDHISYLNIFVEQFKANCNQKVSNLKDQVKILEL